MSDIDTLDLIQSYLTERRVCGLYRRKGYNGKYSLILSHKGRIFLAQITASGTKATITSDWLKGRSANKSNTVNIELSDPQGLEKVIELLETIVKIFNSFYGKLNLYKGPLADYITFPKDACGEAFLG